MAYYALSFPKISTVDLVWIQTIRKSHDPQYALVAPHFTLVFGVEIDKAELTTHVQAVVQSYNSFVFAMRCALVVKDSFSPNYNLFLVPDDGLSELVKLHDALYTAVLAPHLRLDVPYIPHITIAGSADAAKMKQLADELNAQSFCIEGKVEQVDLVQFAGDVLTAVKSFKLEQE